MKQWHSGFLTKKEAEAARIEILSRMNRGTYVNQTRMTIVELGEEWLEATKGTVEDTTLVSYSHDLRRCVYPTLGPDWVTRRARRLADHAKVPWLGIHNGMRHGWATWALERGIPAKVVQERLGHSSISITLDLYSHVSPSLDREAAESVAEILT